MTTWLLYIACAMLAAYLLAVLAFIVAGRRTDARALAGFVPDCVVLFSRLFVTRVYRAGARSSWRR